MTSLGPSQLRVKKEIIEKMDKLNVKVLFLLGKKGVGKTTLIKNLANEFGDYHSLLDEISSKVNITSEAVIDKIREVCLDKKGKWILIDDIDPLLYIMKLNSQIDSFLIQLLRTNYHNDILICSTLLIDHLIVGDSFNKESSAVALDLIKSYNIIRLDFKDEDNTFVMNSLRKKPTELKL